MCEAGNTLHSRAKRDCTNVTSIETTMHHCADFDAKNEKHASQNHSDKPVRSSTGFQRGGQKFYCAGCAISHHLARNRGLESMHFSLDGEMKYWQEGKALALEKHGRLLREAYGSLPEDTLPES